MSPYPLPLASPAPLAAFGPRRCQLVFLGRAGLRKAHLRKQSSLSVKAGAQCFLHRNPQSLLFSGASRDTPPPKQQPLPAPSPAMGDTVLLYCASFHTSVLSLMDFWKLACFGGPCFLKTSLGGK